MPPMLAAILDLFPNCAVCGRAVTADASVVQCEGRNRVRHATDCHQETTR